MFYCLRSSPARNFYRMAKQDHPGEVSLNLTILRAPGWLRWLSLRLFISAQIIISWFVRQSPAQGSALTPQSLLGILTHPLLKKINSLDV